MRGIFDDDTRAVGQRTEVDRQAGEMHRDERVGGGRDLVHCDVERVGIDVDEIDVRADEARATRTRDESEWRRHDRIAGTEASGGARAVQGGRPVRERDGIPRADAGRDHFLELLDRRPFGEPVALQDFDDGVDVIIVNPLPTVRDHRSTAPRSRVVCREFVFIATAS